MLIDTHCHLNHERFDGDADEVIARAAAAGVERLIVVGADLPTSERAVAMAESHPSIYATVGVHPHDARLYDADVERRLRGLAAHPRVVAVGETGLDYHYDYSPRDVQRRAFEAHLSVASDTGLPAVIHCREAYGDALDILAGSRGLNGVMHCWAGTPAEAEQTLAMGLYLGFGGVLTFRNAEETRGIAASVPLDRVLLETDAPYLAPVPHRGHRNEPGWVALVAAALAPLRGLEVEALADATTANALRLFTRMRL